VHEMKSREDEEEEDEEEDLFSANEESEFDGEWEPPGKKIKATHITKYDNFFISVFVYPKPKIGIHQNKTVPHAVSIIEPKFM
jgi:hypothetical protein